MISKILREAVRGSMEFWAVGGAGASSAPLDPPLELSKQFSDLGMGSKVLCTSMTLHDNDKFQK